LLTPSLGALLKDKVSLFQCESSENGELCIGFSLSPTITIPITKAGLIVNINFFATVEVLGRLDSVFRFLRKYR